MPITEDHPWRVAAIGPRTGENGQWSNATKPVEKLGCYPSRLVILRAENRAMLYHTALPKVPGTSCLYTPKV
ncbi:MAG: hypothetical protein ACREUA_03735, partial [Burkholderiales bacterium]